MNKRKQNNYSCCFLAHTKKWENKYKELKNGRHKNDTSFKRIGSNG